MELLRFAAQELSTSTSPAHAIFTRAVQGNPASATPNPHAKPYTQETSRVGTAHLAPAWQAPGAGYGRRGRPCASTLGSARPLRPARCRRL